MYAVVGEHLLPQVAIDTAREVSDRYADLDLQFVPESMRTSPNAPPYALINTVSGDLIRYFDESEIHANYVLQWLYDNDSNRVGEKALWDKFVQHVDDEKRARENKKNEAFEERVDFVATMQASPKHIYRHNGLVFGA